MTVVKNSNKKDIVRVDPYSASTVTVCLEIFGVNLQAERLF